MTQTTGVPFTKGHGTANDFVLLSDPDGTLSVEPDDVARLCDRRRGIGADGVIRAIRSAALPEGRGVAAEAEWFMDYRNADGSVAEMCGNGVRVFVAHLLDQGLVTAADVALPGGLAVGTRAGVKRVQLRENGWYAVDMGPWRLVGGEQAVANGGDATVRFEPAQVEVPALSVDLGNPHTVVVFPDEASLEDLRLWEAPVVQPVPPHGSNVEIIVVESTVRPDHQLGRLRMRVHERGVGETFACGTGACAAMLAARAWGGAASPRRWVVVQSGGEVEVALLPGGNVELSGPAELVATGVTSLLHR